MLSPPFLFFPSWFVTLSVGSNELTFSHERILSKLRLQFLLGSRPNHCSPVVSIALHPMILNSLFPFSGGKNH